MSNIYAFGMLRGAIFAPGDEGGEGSMCGAKGEVCDVALPHKG